MSSTITQICLSFQVVNNFKSAIYKSLKAEISWIENISYQCANMLSKRFCHFSIFPSLLLDILRYDLPSCHNATSIKGFNTLYFIIFQRIWIGLTFRMQKRLYTIPTILLLFSKVSSIVDSFCIGYPLMYLDRICIWPQPFFSATTHKKGPWIGGLS